MAIPYENATSGAKAREDITKLLRRFGAESVGFMDEFDSHSVSLAFTYRGRRIQLRASAEGWANLYLREHPWNTRRVRDKRAYQEHVLAQGMVSVNSMLRDWVKGQVTAIECGMTRFDHVFLPYMLTNQGHTVAEVLTDERIDQLTHQPESNA
ncbi:MAG: hypothetical protein OXC08_20635 [Thiotrichales bacterium]|nr:hypothetical protein [Thiotrichales bacterium]